MIQTNFIEEIITHILFSVTCLENRDVYEIMWKNIVERGRPQMTIWRVRIACWVPKATNTHSLICNIYCFSTATIVARTLLIVTSHILCLPTRYPDTQ